MRVRMDQFLVFVKVGMDHPVRLAGMVVGMMHVVMAVGVSMLHGLVCMPVSMPLKKNQ